MRVLRRLITLALVSPVTVMGPAVVPVQALPGAVPSSVAAAVVLIDCSHKPQVEPYSYVLTCADANDQLTKLQWTNWGPNAAVATGYQRVNDCVPYCAAGQVHTYPVKVKLSDPRPWPGHAGRQQFMRLTLTYPGAKPTWPHRTTYTLWS